jgi:amino acid transporter
MEVLQVSRQSADMVNCSIFSTPATILRLSGSPGMALMCWLIGGVIATSGTLVFLELGTAIPRSGGVKNYLERAFSPRLMQSCIYIFYCVFLRESLYPTIIYIG